MVTSMRHKTNTKHIRGSACGLFRPGVRRAAEHAMHMLFLTCCESICTLYRCLLVTSSQALWRSQAQQRYRERRKQRFAELESTLDSMSAQLQQLQGVQQQNQALQARPHDMRNCSVHKEGPDGLHSGSIKGQLLQWPWYLLRSSLPSDGSC